MSALGSLGTLLRTLRHIEPRQAVAQAIHGLRGIGAPVRIAEEAPALASLDPVVPFLPAPPHARFDGTRAVSLINQDVVFEQRIDWEYAAGGPLFAYHLHQCDYLRAPALTAEARAAVVLDWVARHRSGVGWDPHPICLRVLAWGKLLSTPGALALSAEDDARVRLSMAEQIETLDRNIEVRLQANHLLSNLIGIVFGAVLLEGERADHWLRRAGWLAEQLDRQILADGAHTERSPMYHALLLENVLDLVNVGAARPGRLPRALEQGLRAHAGRMLGALDVWLHPDGEIALFSDSAFGIAQSAAALRGYATALGVRAQATPRPGVLDRAGYVRIESEPFGLIASVAGPLPACQPGHAHCDALSFELSCGSERVVTDTGVFEYRSGPERTAARSTAGHSTLQIGSGEQAEIWSAHRVGGRPSVRLEEVEPLRRAVASCRPWSEPLRCHRRTFFAQPRAIEVVDELEGGPCPVTLRLPLAPGLEPRLAHDRDGGTEAYLPLQSGARVRIALPAAATWRIERADYFPEFGRRFERACLVGESADYDSGTYRFELLE